MRAGRLLLVVVNLQLVSDPHHKVAGINLLHANLLLLALAATRLLFLLVLFLVCLLAPLVLLLFGGRRLGVGRWSGRACAGRSRCNDWKTRGKFIIYY